MITFHLPSTAVERLAFAYSPVLEAVLSLHVLVEPKHHPIQHQWVRQMQHLSPALKREIAALPLPPSEMLRVLRALADDTRLRALRLIAEQPRSTQELAPLIGLSEAALSKHLRLLAEAGILEAHRTGYYVLYHLVPEQITIVMESIHTYLETPASGLRSNANILG